MKLNVAAIRPLRHHIVYPALIRQIAAAWRRRDPSTSASRAAA